jgi:hypothetical protein
MPVRRQVAARAKYFFNCFEQSVWWCAAITWAARRRHHRYQTLVMLLEPGKVQSARALLAPVVSQREKPAQVLVPTVLLDQERQYWRLDLLGMKADAQLGADDDALADFTSSPQSADRAVESIAIA